MTQWTADTPPKWQGCVKGVCLEPDKGLELVATTSGYSAGATNVKERSARVMRCARTCTVALLYTPVSPQNHSMRP